ncbi:hypothetical protein ACQ4PT_064266 [Festuca glaucescens]
MAAVLEMETVRLATPSGQAKVFGTVVCVGGSMIMPFYKGPLLKGFVGSGIAFAVMSWCIQTRGPLFVSMFSPLILVVVGWAILEEKIYVRSAIGSALIVAGLYMVLWGKAREASGPADLSDNGALVEKEASIRPL